MRTNWWDQTGFQFIFLTNRSVHFCVYILQSWDVDCRNAVDNYCKNIVHWRKRGMKARLSECWQEVQLCMLVSNLHHGYFFVTRCRHRSWQPGDSWHTGQTEQLYNSCASCCWQDFTDACRDSLPLLKAKKAAFKLGDWSNTADETKKKRVTRIIASKVNTLFHYLMARHGQR